MIILTATSSRLTIVNHLRQSIATVSYEPMEVRLALCAIEQSYHLPAVDRRAAIKSARYAAADIAPLESLSGELRDRVIAYRERKASEAATLAAHRAESQRKAAEEAAALSPEDLAALPARIAFYDAKRNDKSVGKSSRKRASHHARDLRALLSAAEAL
jgi:hypothetical protein